MTWRCHEFNRMSRLFDTDSDASSSAVFSRCSCTRKRPFLLTFFHEVSLACCSSCLHHGDLFISAIIVHTATPLTNCFIFVTMGNEQSTTPYEPKKLSITSSSNAKPIKSAMRRTSSVNEVASDLSQTSITSKQRYLPNGLGAGHSGLVMPTKPGDVAAGGPSHGPGGYHSPEWGWYINTTPPTPEMFHSQYSSTRGKLLSSKDPSQSHVPSSGPPAFTPGISTSSKTGMGWPSVPL